MARILHTHEPAAPWRAASPAAKAPAAAPATPGPGIGAIEFMGGRRWFKTVPQSRAEIHGALVKGVPYAMLVNLVDQLTGLSADEVADAVGISARTLRRQKEQPGKLMPPDLASRTWQLAEVLVQASAVLGGRAEAERWMARPATGLDGSRPIDLLRTLQGAELVTEFLGRLEHGVYS
ncbi:type II RES/Xre toxin-antitoxin system antitoxin [Aquabacterium sp. OR-4]|uniref:type II RES/Xre toxin-antitoxin system antitoxin n=1 Tax=Aquabacterium sp. OR-4 TaxID=2978127 RepID=UPI0021B498D2|nr:antitoxin Xre/MbcA/ParS toxin-binding domain-containing protein [Aquabacterium sp. OR-4]MDT7838378.1 antitoxin Xre/MbcA/ParS toxin-binding domain-containing protein [Aquabacterium sp. OR-4]